MCGAFWAHVLGKDIRNEYLSFLELAKSADQWVKPTMPQSIVEGMKERNDPIAIQRAITSFVLQDSLSSHVGVGKIERMILMTEYWDHCKALSKDLYHNPSISRHFLRHEIDWANVKVDRKAAMMGKIICVGLRNKEYNYLDNMSKLQDFGKQCYALDIIRTRFGVGAFVFLLDLPMATYVR